MQLNPVASTVLISFYLVTSIALIALLAFFLYAFSKLNTKLELLESKINPSLIKTEEMLALINSKIVTFGERTEEILTHGEAIAEEVHEKADRTAANVQRTINAPIIGLNSVAAGVVHGLLTFSLLQRRQGRKKMAEDIQMPALSPSISLSVDLLTPSAVDKAVNSNGAPATLYAGREN